MNRFFNRIFSLCTLAVMAGCASSGSSKTAESAAEAAPVPQVVFDADSAYSFVAQQVAFGPRVPGSAAHTACADWLLSKLNDYGASTVDQRAVLTDYTGRSFEARNISGSFNPDAQKRILLLSHWDSRPWADQESDPALREKPIDGANDGASGVGVILEIARLISQSQPKVGVDVLFVDAEDSGTRADDPSGEDASESWCLGTQYWVQNPTIDVSKVRYAVLLDMVGGKNAVFPREYFSEYAHKDVNDRVWRAAKDAGYGDRFVDNLGTGIIDDHIHLIQAGIPAIDIIETNHPATSGFNPTWHTHADNMDNIDAQTLKAVGQTLVNLIY